MGHSSQLAVEGPTAGGARAVVLSASKELEPGTRAMLLVADDLFRLDVLIEGDTLRTVVRNLSSGPLEVARGSTAQHVAGFVVGEVARYEPGSTGLEFSLGHGKEQVAVSVVIGTLQVPGHGAIRVTGQAVLRAASA